MILWQCLLDEVLSNKLSPSKCSAVRATKCHRVLSQVEQNAVRYFGSNPLLTVLSRHCLHTDTIYKEKININCYVKARDISIPLVYE